MLWILIYYGIALLLLNTNAKPSVGMLYPRESETREVRSLDGLWNFLITNNSIIGLQDKWYLNDLKKFGSTLTMPVPASYNDITTEMAIRDHVGPVWYDRKFFVSKYWKNKERIWLRFGSVHYIAFVYINGKVVVTHEMGHLPFETEITEILNYGAENRITVMCDNTLLQNTVPQGRLNEESTDDGVSFTQSYTFDFFNYAGIHRSVHLFTTPLTYIEEIIITTDFDNKTKVGIVNYEVKVNNMRANDALHNILKVRIQLRDKDDNLVVCSTPNSKFEGKIEVENVRPWWPYLMHHDPGYLYEMEVFLFEANETLIDVYRLKIGIRSLNWNKSTMTINERPIYFRGFGRHEDSDIRGKGLDLPLMVRDFNLLKWIGANAYRTSHYPYSEESMQFADEHGIMIIDECPSVDTHNFNQGLLNKHKSAMEQLIHRDRNHPCVVMWSIANEPSVDQLNAATYFQYVADYTRKLDPSRPVTAAIATPINNEKIAKYLDIISFNRYNGWYSKPGHLDMITPNVINEANKWYRKLNKPVLMAEYGADTLEGMHSLPAYIWSEEYQIELYSRHFRAFDILRQESWFIGEFVWNFADFKTAQTYTRVGGNKKGVFTRNRQPKGVAYLLRRRYFSLCQEIDGCSLIPKDLFTYIASNNMANGILEKSNSCTILSKDQ